jgi:hypothetical protein
VETWKLLSFLRVTLYKLYTDPKTGLHWMLCRASKGFGVRLTRNLSPASTTYSFPLSQLCGLWQVM